MNPELSRRAAAAMPLLLMLMVSAADRARFAQAVAAAPSEADLPAFAADLLKRADDERSRIS